MCHLGYVEDDNGNVVQLNYYCSDYCNSEHNVNYAGWNGCHENHHAEYCGNCGTLIAPSYATENFELTETI